MAREEDQRRRVRVESSREMGRIDQTVSPFNSNPPVRNQDAAAARFCEARAQQNLPDHFPWHDIVISKPFYPLWGATLDFPVGISDID
jgi:hypothetical protein